MNTDCSKCIFSETGDDTRCSFNIPNMIKEHYDISIVNNYNYIDNYKCSYAFSKETYDKHIDNLPQDMMQLMREQNEVAYYLIINCEKCNTEEIEKIFIDHINNLLPIPKRVSIICHVNKDDLKSIIEEYKNNKISWKVHNTTMKDLDDTEKLYDILNVNTKKDNEQILYIDYKSISDLQDDMNYINYLIHVRKPSIAGIRKSDDDLDGLCLSTSNLKNIKFEYKHTEKGYIDFLRKDNTVIKKYYEQ